MVDKKITIVAAIVIVIAIIGIAGIAIKNKTTTPEEITVKVTGYWEPTSPSGNSVWTAEELGYLKGIKIEEVYLAEMANRPPALSADRADAAHLTYASAIRAIAKGVKIKAVAAAHDPDGVLTSPTFFVLADSNITSAKDLKGKRVSYRPGSTSHLVFAEYLRANGLSTDDLYLTSIPTGQEEQTLRSKQIDVIAVVSVALIAGIKERGGVRVLFTQNDILPKGNHHCGLFVSEKLIREKPDTLKNFLEGFVNAADWERENPDKTKEIYIKFAKERGADPEQISKYYEPSEIRKHSFVEDSDIQWFIDKLVERGELKEGQIKPSDIYTNEFNPYYKK